MADGNGAASALPMLTVGMIVGGLGALLGVKVRHHLRDTDFEARRVSERIAAVADRIDSLRRLEIADEHQRVVDRVAEIEQRIARAAGRQG